MKERPILFSGQMVRALLDGSKTQTRRIVKPQPIEQRGWVGGAYWERKPARGMQPADQWCIRDIPQFCPHGQPGDRLWVRESFRFTSDFDADSPARVGKRCLDAGYRTAWAPIQYDADGAQRDWGWVGTPPGHAVTAGRTRASMHMPRWASRITLEVTGVRVERLHDITDVDALSEGVDRTNTSIPGYARERFVRLWTSINGNESWPANPWVWVVEFKRIGA